MNKESRKNRIKKILKQAEQDTILKKIAEDSDVNAAADADNYSEKVFQKLLNDIKIEGLED